MPVSAAPCFSNRAPRDTKKPFTFSFLSDRHFDKQKPLQRNKEFEVFKFCDPGGAVGSETVGLIRGADGTDVGVVTCWVAGGDTIYCHRS